MPRLICFAFGFFLSLGCVIVASIFLYFSACFIDAEWLSLNPFDWSKTGRFFLIAFFAVIPLLYGTACAGPAYKETRKIILKL